MVKYQDNVLSYVNIYRFFSEVSGVNVQLDYTSGTFKKNSETEKQKNKHRSNKDF